MKTLSAAAVSGTKWISRFYKKKFTVSPAFVPAFQSLIVLQHNSPTRHSSSTRFVSATHISPTNKLTRVDILLAPIQSVIESFQERFLPRANAPSCLSWRGHMPRWQASHQSTVASCFFQTFNTG